MRRMFMCALLLAPLAVAPSQAQERLPRPSEPYPNRRYASDPYSPGTALVTDWIHRYMGRQPNRQDIANGRAIDAGTQDPIELLAGILASKEYYDKAGGDDAGYIRRLYADVAGREPSRREMDTWMRRLYHGPTEWDGNTDLAFALLRQYPPPSLAPPRP